MKRLGAFVGLLLLALAPVATLRAQGRGGEILRAVYGSGYHWIDVTERVRAMFRASDLDFSADNSTLGGDPAPGAWKTLRLVVRERNGRIRELEFPEGQYVTLRGYNFGNNDRGLRILGAQYGSPNRMIDVTDRVNSQIRGDQLSLRVANQTMGGDPARNQPKALTVWYTFNGRPGQVTVNESDTLNLPGNVGYGDRRDARDNPGNQGYPDNRGFGDNRNGRDQQGALQITRAQYGVGNRVVDVTDRLNAQIRGGQLNLQVQNDVMGGDPARNQPKMLTVWYTFNGRPGQVTVNEAGYLNLPGDPGNNNGGRDNRR